jgi:hypothetical protein
MRRTIAVRPFDVPGEQALAGMREPTNPNGRTNSEVLKPYWNGGKGVWTSPVGMCEPRQLISQSLVPWGTFYSAASLEKGSVGEEKR